MRPPIPQPSTLPRRRRHLVAGTAALGLAGCLQASTVHAQSAPSREAEVLEEVVITATPLRRAAFATAQPVALLDGERLATAIRNSLGETLVDQPGVSASAFGPIASRPIIRGQGGLRVQTYVDGADTLDVAALSDDHAVTVEPLLAERIEIVRGPAALLFGSAAAAGAVNVVTGRLPLVRSAVPLAGELHARGDTAANERGIAARIAGNAGGSLQFTGDMHHFSAGNLRIPDGRLENSAGETRGGNVGIGWVGERGAFAVSVSNLRSNYGLAGGHAHHDHDDDEHDHDHDHDHEHEHDEEAHGDVTLALDQQRVDIAGEWRLDGFADALRLRAARNDYGHSELEGDEIGTTYGQLGREARLSLDRDGRWTIGTQWREVEFDAAGDEAFLPTSRTRNLGAFAFGEFVLGNLTIEAGLRLEQQDINVAQAAPLAPAKPLRRYDEQAQSASLGVLWPIATPWDLSLQLTSTERHPTATELFAYGPHIAAQRFEIGDERLQLERGLTADLALRHRNAAGWSGSVGVFVADYDRFIAALPTDEMEDGLRVVRFAAIDARFTGVEFNWGNEALARAAAGTLGLRVFGDYVRARDAAGTPLPQIPPRRLGLDAGWTRNGLRLGVETVWNDAQDDVAVGETTTAGFTAVNAQVTYRLRTGGADMLWYVRGVNLLDEVMRRHASPLKDVAPLAARHLTVGVQVGF
jgi:iron complex outermembrane receptor protein